MNTIVERARFDAGAEPLAPVGASTELGVLLAELSEARATGRTRVVFVSGPKGVGKSHLVANLREVVAARGVTVFEGASGRDAQRPYGVAAPLVREVLGALGRAGVPSAKLAELAGAVEPLFDTEASARPQVVTAVLGERRAALVDGVNDALSLAARANPVFVWPDLDAADRASLELIRSTIRALSTNERSGGGLVVATLRDDGSTSGPLGELLASVPARALRLRGFSPEELRVVLSGPALVQRVFDVTQGNPEVLHELLERPLPAAEFFVHKYATAPALTQRVLTVLCVANGPVTTELVASAASASLAAAAHALDALVRERVLTVRVVDGVAGWRFSRERDVSAWRQSRSPLERETTVVEVARALARAGEVAAAATLALGSELAEVPREAHRWAVEAAAALASRGAFDDARSLLERVLPWVERDASAVALRARGAQTLGGVLAASGAFGPAARRLLEAARVGAPEHRVALRVEAAAALLRCSQPRRAAVVLNGVPRDVAPAVRAEGALLEGRPADALAMARAALSQEGAWSPDERFALRQVEGKALLVTGALTPARQAFAENAAFAERVGLHAERVAQARLNEGVAAFRLGERSAAASCWANVGAGSSLVRAVAEANAGSLEADAGDFEAAIDHLGRALNALSRFKSGREVSMAASNLARVHLAVGEFDRALELAECALRHATVGREPTVVASAELTLGAVWFERHAAPGAGGPPGVAHRWLEQARAGFERAGDPAAAALAAATKARAHLAVGERAQAEVELQRAVVELGCAKSASARLEVELARGEWALAAGDVHLATRSLARAKEALLGECEAEGPIRVTAFAARVRRAAGDSAGAQLEVARAGRALEALAQRLSAGRRRSFWSIRWRAEVLSQLEPVATGAKWSAPVAPMQAVGVEHGLVGQSPAMARLVKQLEPVGRSNATVLLRGESGTGKELLAEALHALSGRRHMPLVKVNCAAMVEELLLSELFGHEKGAFTGAVRERKGRFEIADGGSIFLDEIGDISPKAQVALLRVLQEREFERVGGSKTVKVDVRVMCATNRDLETAIAQGRFRADLYYRLKGVMLELPPLRERLGDLPALARHFLSRWAEANRRPTPRLDEEALELLARHSWPGNIREFENVVSSAAIFAEGPEIGVDAFAHVNELRSLMADARPEPPHDPPPRAPEPALPPVAQPTSSNFDFYELARERAWSLKALRREVEVQCISRALNEAGGNISEAARLLKMKRSRLSQIVNAEPSLKEISHGDN